MRVLVLRQLMPWRARPRGSLASGGIRDVEGRDERPRAAAGLAGPLARLPAPAPIVRYDSLQHLRCDFYSSNFFPGGEGGEGGGNVNPGGLDW